MRGYIGIAAAVLMTVGGAGLAHAQPYAPVPPPRFEAVPPPPGGPRAVWEPGHWQWGGSRYDWIGGHYIAYRTHRDHYIPGEWVRRGPGFVWVPAHWQ